MDKREQWFREGAPLFRRALEQLQLADRLPNTQDDYYACPCCLIAYPFEAVEAKVLTTEHVPPDALGGRGMLLTCKHCNNNAGRYFDVHAIKRANVHNFLLRRETNRPVRAVFLADGISVRGEVQSYGTGWLMQGVPKQNDPAMLAAHEKALREASERGEAPTFTFTLTERFSPQHADLSWIRSAYLAAFAALGWRYILRAALDPIRAQLKSNSPTELPLIIGFNPKADSNARSIMIVREPECLSSVHVVIGHYSVFLPDPWGTLSLQELAESIAGLSDETGCVTAELSGQVADWPTKATYLLDKLTR
ncbi:HNH endonuclease [Streptomyces sp. NPDC006855]|uniref:HNH endonuclease n=1 Tax=Streptomyces sp. NPDC006855 TaxID=3364765 RepID=UPI003674F670